MSGLARIKDAMIAIMQVDDCTQVFSSLRYITGMKKYIVRYLDCKGPIVLTQDDKNDIVRILKGIVALNENPPPFLKKVMTIYKTIMPGSTIELDFNDIGYKDDMIYIRQALPKYNKPEDILCLLSLFGSILVDYDIMFPRRFPKEFGL
jgi:hypothetical protein